MKTKDYHAMLSENFRSRFTICYK